MLKNYSYYLNGLDCANCARKIEDRLKQDKSLKNVSVNFANLKLTFKANKDINKNYIESLVQSIEPAVVLTENKLDSEKKDLSIITLIIGTLIASISVYVKLPFWFSEILFVIAYIVLLFKVGCNALKLILKSKIIDENALIVISCVGAYFVDQKIEGLIVIILYTIGKILEKKAINNTRRSIKNLMNIKQDYANKKENDNYKVINVEDVKRGDILLIKKGEKIPVDGILIKGRTKLDTASLTGESDLIEVNINDELLSGCINMDNIIEMEVTSEFENSTVNKILKLVEEATDKKAKTETLVTKLSRIYTPIVLILALCVAVFLPLLTSVSYEQSIYRSLIFLVVSCPCAIAISVPLSYFTGIGVASKFGILIKGSNYLDNLCRLKKIVFDKTGTITNGVFEVKKINIIDNNYIEDEIVDLLVKGESFSNHPIAKSIVKLACNKINTKDVSNYQEISGKGISYELNDNLIKIGNSNFCNDGEGDKSLIYLNYNNNVIASIEINDGIKCDAQKTIQVLKSYNIESYMFTGDNEIVAKEVAKRIGIDNVKAGLLPQDKYRELEMLLDNKHPVAFVGDGINDAPVLKRSDIGISMGGLGSNQAIEASDVVIMNDEISKIILAIEISKKTKRIIKQNLIFAFFIKIMILVLSVFGISNMWEAVFADVGVTLITIINTLRILKINEK